MTKIYQSLEGEYLAFVAHSDDLLGPDGDSYYGLFQYTVQDGEFSIYDFGDNEILIPDNQWSGINMDVLAELTAAASGWATTVDLIGSDYWDVADLYDRVLDNEVLLNAVRAH